MNKNVMGLIGLIMVATGSIAIGMLISFWMTPNVKPDDVSCSCYCECWPWSEKGSGKFDWHVEQSSDAVFNYFVPHGPGDPKREAVKDKKKEGGD